MRWLKVLVVVMGMLIVAGTVTLAVLVVQRAGGAARVGTVVLGLAEGERIVSVAGAGDRFAVQVERAGVSRILLLDPRGRVVGELR